MQKHLLPILRLLAVWLATNQVTALASTCWARQTPCEESQMADAIFAGKVAVANQQIWWGHRIRLNHHPPFIHLEDYGDRCFSTFEVTSVWKGDVTARTYVIHPISQPDVGYSFRQGEEYIVYALKFYDGFSTTACYRNNPLSAAGEDLLAFGPGKPPIPNPSSRRGIAHRLTILFLFLAVIGGAFFALWHKYGDQKS